VGLTGGIGSGKSAAARVFRESGCPTLDLDAVAAEVTAVGQPALRDIAAEFGPGMIRPDGALDRSALARVVFSDPEARVRLESILHPLIRARANEWIHDLRKQELAPAAAILEVPLLFEAGLESEFDRIVLVTADPEVRIGRLTSTRKLSEADARARMASQLPDELKRARSHYVIENNGSLSDLEGKVREVIRRMKDEG